MKNANDFMERAALLKLTSWRLRECMECQVQTHFWFKGALVEVDSGCKCNNDHTIAASSWEDVASYYNSQTEEAVIHGMNRFWRFSAPGGVYQPSNGTDGSAFVEDNCMACESCNPDPDKTPQCDILAASMMYARTDEKYPREWTYDKNGNPFCTARLPWNWDDGHPDDPSGKMPKNESQEELNL